MKKIIKPFLLIISLIVVAVFLVFVTNFFSPPEHNHEPIIVNSFKLDKVPKIVYDDDNYLFHYDDGSVQSVVIDNGVLKFTDILNDVMMISPDSDGYYILDKHNDFKYISELDFPIKNAFVDAVNEKTNRLL